MEKTVLDLREESFSTYYQRLSLNNKVIFGVFNLIFC